MTKLRTEGYSR